LKQDRVPAWVTRFAITLNAVRDLHRRGPSATVVARGPNHHIGMALVGSAEPRRPQTFLSFDNRRGVTALERRGLENEFGFHEAGLMG